MCVFRTNGVISRATIYIDGGSRWNIFGNDFLYDIENDTVGYEHFGDVYISGSANECIIQGNIFIWTGYGGSNDAFS